MSDNLSGEGSVAASYLPHCLLFDERLSRGALKVYSILVRPLMFRHDVSFVDISQKGLSAIVGVDTRTIKRYVSELKKLGLIRVEKPSGKCRFFLEPLDGLYENIAGTFTSEPKVAQVTRDKVVPSKAKTGDNLVPSLCVGGDKVVPSKAKKAPSKPRKRVNRSGTRFALSYTNIQHMPTTVSGVAAPQGREIIVDEETPRGAYGVVKRDDPRRREDAVVEVVRPVTADDCSWIAAGVPKKGRGQKMWSLWGYWRKKMRSMYPEISLSEEAVGSDVGHLKTVLRYCDGDDVLCEKMVEVLFDDWHQIQSKYPIASNKICPTIYLLDTLKQEIQVAAATGKGFAGTGVHRRSTFAGKHGVKDGFEDW